MAKTDLLALPGKFSAAGTVISTPRATADLVMISI